MASGRDRLLNSQAWLIAIRDADDATRVGLIEEFSESTKPLVRRVTATLLRDYGVLRDTWADEVELLVSETLLALVVEVIAGRDTTSQGRALYSVLLTRSRGRFQKLIRGRAHEDSMALAPVTLGMRSMSTESGVLERCYSVVVKHRVSGDTHYIGPFESIVDGLRYAMWVEERLADRGDPQWQASLRPLMDPGRIRGWLLPREETGPTKA